MIDNDADADGDALTAALLDGPSHGALDFAADGSFTYTPAADFFGADSFTYQVSDGQATSDVATVNLAVAPVNDTPVANDDVIPEHAIAAGAIRVAVIGGSSSSYIAAATQLEDSTAFSIDADPISAKAFTTQDQWAALIENYDVVVLGDSGTGMDYGATPLFPALRDFVDAGGGVVTSGWFAYIFPTLSGTARSDADYITPIGTQTYKYAAKNSTITIVDPSHPITDGIASYKVNATVHELAGGVDADATVLAAERRQRQRRRCPPSWWTTWARGAPPISARCRWRRRRPTRPTASPAARWTRSSSGSWPGRQARGTSSPPPTRTRRSASMPPRCWQTTGTSKTTPWRSARSRRRAPWAPRSRSARPGASSTTPPRRCSP